MKKVGIIGCGGIARVHTWVLSQMADVRLTALCDVDIRKAEKLYEEVTAGEALEGVGNADGPPQKSHIDLCDDWREFCNADLDVIHVCTPHHLHAPMAVELLNCGKAVFVEKPCAISMEQFGVLWEQEKSHAGKMGFCFQNRYNETTLLLDRILGEGKIGRVLGGRVMVTWRRDASYYEGSPWKGRLETEGGGALINQSIHTLDLLLRYLGKPVKVQGSVHNHHLQMEGMEVEDTVEAFLEFQGGRRACFFASNAYAMDAPVYLELQGETGRVCMNGSEVTVFRDGALPVHYDCEQAKGIGKGYWGCGHRACIEDFYRCLQTGDIFQNSLGGVENTWRTVMRIYEAAGRKPL